MTHDDWLRKAGEIPEDWYISAQWAYTVIIKLIKTGGGSPSNCETAWEQVENRSVCINED